MKEEEIDWDKEAEASTITEHFKQPIAQVELEKKLARYHELKAEVDIMQDAVERLKAEILEAGKGQESVAAGKYVAFLQTVQGRVSCEWQKAYKDAVGEMTEEDVKKYVTRGKDSIRLTVKRI